MGADNNDIKTPTEAHIDPVPNLLLPALKKGKQKSKTRPPRRRRPRRHGVASRHTDDAGDTSTVDIAREENGTPVCSPPPEGFSAPEESSSAENQNEEAASPPHSAKKDIGNLLSGSKSPVLD